MITIEEAARQLNEQRHQIIEDYVKAFTCAESIDSLEEMAWLIKNIELHIQQMTNDGQIYWKVWCTLKEKLDDHPNK